MHRIVFRLFRANNAVVGLLLRSRLHRLLSRWLVLLTYTGRRTGRSYTLPVMAARDGDRLVVIASGRAGKVWWRNFDETPRPVRVVVDGATRPATAVRLSGAAADAARATYVGRYPRAAKPASDAALLVLNPTD